MINSLRAMVDNGWIKLEAGGPGSGRRPGYGTSRDKALSKVWDMAHRHFKEQQRMTERNQQEVMDRHTAEINKLPKAHQKEYDKAWADLEDEFGEH